MNIQQNPNYNNQNNAADSSTVLNAKWGRDVMALGYTVVPDVLLTHMAVLGLTPAELVMILQLLRYWWSPEQMPFPSKRKLAEAIGCSEKNVQKVIARLEYQGYIRRIQRRHPGDRSESNVYDMRPLLEMLEPLVICETRERRQKAAARQDLMDSVRRGINGPRPASNNTPMPPSPTGDNGYRPATRDPNRPSIHGLPFERI